MIGSVYKIKNLVNHKSYIGITVRDPVSRWWEHCNSAKLGSDYFIHQAIRKYGEFNFEFQVIAQTKTVEHLKELEVLLIEQHETYMSTQKGYNKTRGGDGATFIRKTSGIVIGSGERTGLIDCDDPRWETGEIIHFRKGVPWPDESRKRASEYWKGKRKGVNNGNAKNFKLISPEGVVYDINGNCRSYVEDLGLKYSALYDYIDKGKPVPPPSVYHTKNVSTERLATVGWSLVRTSK